MAKEVKVSIIVDDNGTMRLTEKSAKKLGAGLDNAGSRLPVVHDQSIKRCCTNCELLGSKNFSKQAQGLFKVVLYPLMLL